MILKAYSRFTLRLAGLLLVSLAAGCATQQPPASVSAPISSACPKLAPCPTCPACPAPTASAAPRPTTEPALVATDWSALSGWADDDLAAAWPAFRDSCKAILRQPNWREVCSLASSLPEKPSSATVRQFIEQHFSPWQSVDANGSDTGLITGYYEPLIKGSRIRSAQYRWPIHSPPDDMLTIDLASIYPELKSLRLRGRIVGNRVVPYWSRAELDQRPDQLAAKVLFWAADPIDLFFLQVQGSGRIDLPDGEQVRVGYADQNGHPYQSIGRWLVAQGELSLEQASMEGIKQWARSNPTRLAEMLNSNPSYVFFRELPPDSNGPVGALGVPVAEGRSLAIDPAHIPLGAPVFLSTTWPFSSQPLNRLMLAQDTGSAIKGPVRADFFWGFGAKAGAQAGKMRQPGRLWVLLPKGVSPSSR